MKPFARAWLSIAAAPALILATAAPALADRGCDTGRACLYQHAYYEGGRKQWAAGVEDRDYPAHGTAYDNGVRMHNQTSSVRNRTNRSVVLCHHGRCLGDEGTDWFVMYPGGSIRTWDCQSGGEEGQSWCWNDVLDGHYWR